MPPYVTDNHERAPRHQLILAVAMVGLAVVLRISPPDSQQQIASFFRGTVLAPFVLIQEGLAASRVHAESTEGLQLRLDSLEAIIANQRSLGAENSELRELLGLGQRLDSRFVAASVIRAGTSMSESSFVLDVGSEDGVREDVTVLTGEGILGVVSGVGTERSSAIDWTHPDFRASAMTTDGTTFGIVRAVRSDFREADRLRMDGVPFQQQLEPGTLIVTSGLGDAHPRGIPIGVIDSDAESELGTGWRRSYWVRPAVAPGSATHVLVLVGQADTLVDLSTQWEPDAIPSDSVAGTTGGVGR